MATSTPLRNSYNNSTIPPPPPFFPFHAWKPGRAMFISLFFFPSFFFFLLLPPSLSVPLPSRARRTPHVSRFSRHYQTTTLSTTPVSHTREATTIERAERVISRDVDEVEVIPKGRRGRGIPPSARGCEGSNGEERVARGTLPLAAPPSTTTWREQRRWWTPV